MPLCELEDMVSAGNDFLVKDALSKSSTIDILKDEGLLVKLAISSGNPKVVELLFKYFNDNQLSYCQDRSVESVMLKNQMRDIIEGRLQFITLTDEMKAVLSTYYDFDQTESDQLSVGDELDHQSIDQHNGAERVPTSVDHVTLSSEVLQAQKSSHSFDLPNSSILSWLAEQPLDSTNTVDSTLLGHVTNGLMTNIESCTL